MDENKSSDSKKHRKRVRCPRCDMVFDSDEEALRSYPFASFRERIIKKEKEKKNE